MSRPFEVYERQFNGDTAVQRLPVVTGIHRHENRRSQMSTLKAFSAAVILSAAVVTPVLPQPVHHTHVHLHHFRGAYNQMTEPFVAPRAESGRAYEDYTY